MKTRRKKHKHYSLKHYFSLSEIIARPVVGIYSNRIVKAFTLVELLVVISIVSILASILLPALSKAKKTAMQTYCQGNLKQLGFAFTAYANDFDNALPPYVLGAYNAIDGKYWTNKLHSGGYLGKQRMEQHYNGAWRFGDFISGILRCPSVQRKQIQWGGGYGVPEGGSGAHCLFLPSNVRASINLSQLKRVSELMLVADAQRLDNQKTANAILCPESSCNPWSSAYGQLAHRHNNGGNVCFVDGHLEFMFYKDARNNKNDLFGHGSY